MQKDLCVVCHDKNGGCASQKLKKNVDKHLFPISETRRDEPDDVWSGRGTVEEQLCVETMPRLDSLRRSLRRRRTDRRNQEELIRAINENDVDAVEKLAPLVNQNKFVNGQRCSPFLFTACATTCSTKILQILINNGAGDGCCSKTGDNPLCIAALFDKVQNFKFLLSLGFSLQGQKGRCALRSALMFESLTVLEVLLKLGVSVADARPVYFARPILSAAGWEQEEENVRFRAPRKLFSLKNCARHAFRRNVDTTKTNIMAAVEKTWLPTSLKQFILDPCSQ